MFGEKASASNQCSWPQKAKFQTGKTSELQKEVTSREVAGYGPNPGLPRASIWEAWALLPLETTQGLGRTHFKEVQQDLGLG